MRKDSKRLISRRRKKGKAPISLRYRVVRGDTNWHIKTADWNLAGFFTIYRNLLAGIWVRFLRFIETGFRNWLAAFLGFFYDFSMMSMIFLSFSRIFSSFFHDFYLIL